MEQETGYGSKARGVVKPRDKCKVNYTAREGATTPRETRARYTTRGHPQHCTLPLCIATRPPFFHDAPFPSRPLSTFFPPPLPLATPPGSFYATCTIPRPLLLYRTSRISLYPILVRIPISFCPRFHSPLPLTPNPFKAPCSFPRPVSLL